MEQINYNKYGISEDGPKVTKEIVEKIINSLEFCKKELEKVQRITEEIGKIYNHIQNTNQGIIELAKHVYRLEKLLGLTELDEKSNEKGQ